GCNCRTTPGVRQQRGARHTITVKGFKGTNARPTTCWAGADTKAERQDPSSSATQPYQGTNVTFKPPSFMFNDTWARDSSRVDSLPPNAQAFLASHG
ncbi:hypothetical protein HaLaN_12870, partial [Haematococcus lacustris]